MENITTIEFNRHLTATLDACRGQHIRSVTVLEMAFIDEPPTFVHRGLCFVQAAVLEIAMQSGLLVHFTTWQNDDYWALRVGDIDTSKRLVPMSEHSSSFRTRECDEFPRGEIKSIDVVTDAANAVQEIVLAIADRVVVLRAGEVYEEAGGRLTVRDRDESVLVFFDLESYRSTVFNVPLAYAAIG